MIDLLAFHELQGQCHHGVFFIAFVLKYHCIAAWHSFF